MKQIQHDTKSTGAPFTTNNSALVKLTNTGLALADSGQDIRGRKVVDRHNDEIGHVSSLFIDEAERNVRMIEIHAGGFFGIGERHVLVPVDAIANVDENEVHINVSREQIAGAPPYDPTLIDEPTQSNWEPYYGYYGLSPYWGNGYMYPNFPMSLGERDRSIRSHTTRE